jgi:hypothetical protein
MKDLSQNSQSPGHALNWAPTRHNVKVLLHKPTCSNLFLLIAPLTLGIH